MANPWELLRSARENQRRKARFVERAEKTPPDEAPKPVPYPLPSGGHSAYSAIMRRHDRIHPRIGGK